MLPPSHSETRAEKHLTTRSRRRYTGNTQEAHGKGSPVRSPPGPVHHLQHQHGLQTLALPRLQGDVHSALPQRVDLAAGGLEVERRHLIGSQPRRMGSVRTRNCRPWGWPCPVSSTPRLPPALRRAMGGPEGGKQVGSSGESVWGVRTQRPSLQGGVPTHRPRPERQYAGGGAGTRRRL